MRPILFAIGADGSGPRTYGIAMAAAFIVAVVLGARAARRRALGVALWLDLCFWLLVVGVLASRLLFVITNADGFYSQCVYGTPDPQASEAVRAAASAARSTWQSIVDCTRALHVWEGGLVFYGGFIGAIVFGMLYLRRRGADPWRAADLGVPFVALGHAVGRLGCWAAGCCYGKVSLAGHGARFPRRSLAFSELVQRGLLSASASATPPLLPTQLYEAAGEAAIFLALTWLAARKRYHGQIVVAYLAIYGMLRCALEVLRDDPARRFIVAIDTPSLNAALGVGKGPLLLSTSQGIALLLLAAALVVRRHRRRATAEAAAAAGAS